MEVVCRRPFSSGEGSPRGHETQMVDDRTVDSGG